MELAETELLQQHGWAAMVVALVAVLVGWVFYWSWCSAGTRKLKLELTPPVPPGCFGWPVVGETMEYLGAKRGNTAVQFFRTRVAKYGEVGYYVTARFLTQRA